MTKKDAVDVLRAVLLGKNGYITERLKNLGKLPIVDRKRVQDSIYSDKEIIREALDVVSHG